MFVFIFCSPLAFSALASFPRRSGIAVGVVSTGAVPLPTVFNLAEEAFERSSSEVKRLFTRFLTFCLSDGFAILHTHTVPSELPLKGRKE